jgi:hypothetical protein
MPYMIVVKEGRLGLGLMVILCHAVQTIFEEIQKRDFLSHLQKRKERFDLDMTNALKRKIQSPIFCSDFKIQFISMVGRGPWLCGLRRRLLNQGTTVQISQPVIFLFCFRERNLIDRFEQLGIS